jgi:lipopolysaccharide export system protein LptA
MPCPNRLNLQHCIAHLMQGLLIATITATLALANPADRSKPISISADSSEYDEKASTQVLAGNVEISQGSMVIRADRIKVELKNNTLFRITGSGSPIRFQQLTANNELMRGQSEQISYNTETSEITFKGNAEFERPGQKFSGHSINYNMAKLTFKAAGNDKGRVNIVLQPGK